MREVRPGVGEDVVQMAAAGRVLEAGVPGEIRADDFAAIRLGEDFAEVALAAADFRHAFPPQAHQPVQGFGPLAGAPEAALLVIGEAGATHCGDPGFSFDALQAPASGPGALASKNTQPSSPL